MQEINILTRLERFSCKRQGVGQTKTRFNFFSIWATVQSLLLNFHPAVSFFLLSLLSGKKMWHKHPATFEPFSKTVSLPREGGIIYTLNPQITNLTPRITNRNKAIYIYTTIPRKKPCRYPMKAPRKLHYRPARKPF